MDGTSSSTRLGAFAAFGFAVLLFLTVAVVDAPRAATDEEVLAWWAKESNQTAEIFSMYFALGAGLCFLVFLTRLCARLRAAEGEHAPVSSFVLASGIVFTSLVFVAGAARGAVGVGVRFGDEPLPGVDVLRLVPMISYVALGSLGLVTMGACIAAASWLILRTGVYGRWAGWAGLAVAVALLTSVVIGPWLIPGLLLWSLAMGGAMWRGGAAPGGARTAAPVAQR